MGDVSRLPVQHRQSPHCEACERELPPVARMQLDSPADAWRYAKLEAMTFHVRCECGKVYDMKLRLIDNN